MADLFFIKRASTVRAGSDHVFPILCYKKRVDYRKVSKTNFDDQDQ